MNGKQTIYGNGSPVPILLIIGVGFAFVNWLLSDEDAETNPQTTPADTGAENHGKFTFVPVVSAPIPPISAKISTAMFTPVVPYTRTATENPQQAQRGKRKRIAREDMENIFQCGSQKLTLTAAVAALKSLGFSKTAAYEALSANGRFSAWLQFAPDGMITWKD